MGSGKQIATGVAWTFIYNIFNGIYGFISVPILIAYFGKSDYGLIGLAMSINVYLRLMDLGFNSTNVRFFSDWLVRKDYHRVKRLFSTSLSFYGIIGLLNAAVLLVISFFSQSIFNVTPEQDIILKNLFYILAISAFVSWITSCFEQLISANELVGWVKKLSLLPKLLQVCILILTVTLHFKIEVYYALTAFSLFVLIPFYVSKIHKLCPYVSFGPFFDKDVFKVIIGYSLNIFSFSIFQFSVYYLRPVFLGIESTPESITEYNVLNGIIGIVLMLGGGFVSVVLPSASKVVAQDDKSSQSRIAYKGTKYISIAICFCALGMMSISPELLTAYVGPEYLNLTIWLDLWLISTLCSHNQAISSLILAKTDIRVITYSTLAASIVGLLVCWFLIPVYNVGGTVFAYLAYQLIQILFYYVYYWPRVMKLNSRKIFMHSFFPFFLLGMFLVVIIRVVPISIGVWPSLILKGVVFGVLYFSIVFFTLDKDDKSYLFGILRRN